MHLFGFQSDVFSNSMGHRCDIPRQHVGLDATTMQLSDHVWSIRSHLIEGIKDRRQTPIHREINRCRDTELRISFENGNVDILFT